LTPAPCPDTAISGGKTSVQHILFEIVDILQYISLAAFTVKANLPAQLLHD